MTSRDRNLNSASTEFRDSVKTLFQDAGITLEPGSSALWGASGKISVEGVVVTLRLMPLRRPSYRSKNRTANPALGYRLFLEADNNVPIRLSLVSESIQSLKLIAWTNKIKRIFRVPNELLQQLQYQAWCSDIGWASSVLNRTETIVAITNLLECAPRDTKIGSPCVIITPTSIQYFRRSASIEGLSKMGHYAKNIATICESAASVPAPTLPRHANFLERLFKRKPPLNKGFAVALVLLLLIGSLLLMMLLIGSFIWLISSF